MQAQQTASRSLPLNGRFEPFLVTGVVFLFTALYYTRSLPLQILSMGIMLAGAGYWSFFVRKRIGFDWSSLRLSSRGWLLTTLLALALAFFGWFIFRYYNLLTRGISLDIGYGGSLAALIAILAVSSAEELFFRGYLQNRLREYMGLWGRVLIAVMAIAVFKNIVHMWEGLPLLLHLELFFIGVLHNVVLSVWLEWSDNLLGPLLAHIFWDLLVYAPLAAIPYWVY